jgi:hypothetical protein
MSQAPPKELIAFLKPYDPAMRELMLAVRDFVIGEMAPCYENVLDTSYTLATVFSSTERSIKDGVCLVTIFPRHVNLGFHRGAELDDPLELLEGTGKKMRHIKIRSEADLSHPELRELIRRARELAGLGPADPRSKKGVVSKVSSGQKSKRLKVRGD